MHFLIGFIAVAVLIAFVFGRRAAQVFVVIGLGVPALIILTIIIGEATRGGPDDVPFGKLGHRSSLNTTVEQPVSAEQQRAYDEQQAHARWQAEQDAAARAELSERAKAYNPRTAQPLGGFPPIGK
jgi:hypothetical protein